MIDLRKLRAFVAVAEELNFSRAARRLNMTQPPLSQLIKNLEDDIGARLFERSRNSGVRLTAAGQVLLAGAREALTRVNRLAQEAYQAGQGERGNLSVGHTNDYLGNFLLDGIIRFGQRFPNIHLEVLEEPSFVIRDHVMQGRIDVALLYLPLQFPDTSGLEIYPLPPTPIVVAVPEAHHLAAAGTASLADFKHDNFLNHAVRGRTSFDAIIERLFAEAGFFPKTSLDIWSSVLGLQIIAKGGAVMALTMDSVPVGFPAIKTVKLSEANAKMERAAIFRREAASPLLFNFLDCLLPHNAKPRQKKRS